VIALGCADGIKEALLLKKLPKPAYLVAADTSLSLARRAALRLPAHHKRSCKIDLLKPLSPFPLPPSTIYHPRVVTLFGVLPNLDPLPLLRRVSRTMRPGDLLLFSANLAPAKSGFAGARKVLSQYDNSPTRRWLEAAVKDYRPKLPKGRLKFAVHPDSRQKSLARIEARWVTSQKTVTVFSSRRPTVAQVETWVRLARLKKLARFLDPRSEEGVWLVRSAKS
jgi:SAM-dependent methyltransferase